MKHTHSIPLVLLLISCLLFTACRMDKDYSMRTGSYQAENLKTTTFLEITVYKYGNISPVFYLGDIRMLKGDYRGMLKIDNPTFSEDVLVELLDEDKKLIHEHEAQFWEHPDDDDPMLEVLIRRGAKFKYLTMDKVIVPYDENIAWIKLKKQYIRFYHDRIIRPGDKNFKGTPLTILK